MKEKETNTKIPKELLKKFNMPVYRENWNKRVRPRCFDSRNELQRSSEKVVTLEQAIRASGLKDGMTISFHHHFREGDHVVNLSSTSWRKWVSKILPLRRAVCPTSTRL